MSAEALLDDAELRRARPVPTRLPELDGFRAIAVTLILLHHFGVVIRFLPWYNVIPQGGWIAVPLFFVLSAMLLALPFVSAGLEQRARPDTLGFYDRRVRRILPAYYLSMVAYLVAHAIWQAPQPDVAELLRHVFFLHNLQRPLSAINPPYWSLAAEMQFYVVMPLIGGRLYALGRQGRFRASLAFAGCFIVWPFAYRLVVVLIPGLLARYGYGLLIYESTLSNFDSFGFGFLGAVLFAWASRAGRPIVPSRAVYPLFVASLATLYFAMWFNPEHQANREAEATWFSPPVFYTLLNAGWLGCILSTLSMPRSGWSRLMRSAPIARLSLLSYSIYVWHQLCIGIVRSALARQHLVHGGALTVVKLVLEASLSLVVGALSYYLVEVRFLRKRAARARPA